LEFIRDTGITTRDWWLKGEKMKKKENEKSDEEEDEKSEKEDN
jgi:hypothetical protein